MFTNKAELIKFKQIRNSSTFRTTFLVYDDLWDIMRELEAKRNRTYVHNYKHVQYDLDTEKFHSAELYAMWNLKPYLMARVSESNMYQSDFFIYTDAGAWREQLILNWPDRGFVKQVSERTGDLVLFGQLEPMVFYSPVRKY